jgi:hypothetical protein
MIVLAPIQLTQGEAASLRMNYRENNQPYDFTGWTATWTVVQLGDVIASGTCELQTDGDILTSMTVAQIDVLSVPDQYKGRTLPDTYFKIAASSGSSVLNFRAAVIVLRGLSYASSSTITSTDSLTDDLNTLLAE